MEDTKSVPNSWVRDVVDKKGQEWVDKIAPTLLKRHNTKDIHFAMWMERVNSRVSGRTGMSYDDLEDWDYWSAYAGDTDPVEAAQDMLADIGYDGEGWM